MVEILELMSRYGIWTVVVGVLLYLLFVGHSKAEARKDAAAQQAQKEQEKQKEEEREIERRKQECEKDERMFRMIKELLRPEHTVEEQNSDLQRSTFIIKQLNCLITEGADRAYMFTFHNGGTDVLGRGFLKMSMSQEAIADNIVPIMPKYINMPRTLFPTLYNQLNGKDSYNVYNVEEIKKDDPFTYQFLIEHGAHAALFRAIKKEDGLVIGFIGMEYISRNCEDIKKANKNIEKKVNRIMGALLGQDRIGG